MQSYSTFLTLITHSISYNTTIGRESNRIDVGKCKQFNKQRGVYINLKQAVGDIIVSGTIYQADMILQKFKQINKQRGLHTNFEQAGYKLISVVLIKLGATLSM